MKNLVLILISSLILNACGNNNYASKNDLEKIKADIRADLNNREAQIIPKTEVDQFLASISGADKVDAGTGCQMKISTSETIVSYCSDKVKIRDLKLMLIDRHLNFPSLKTEKYDFSLPFYITKSSENLDEISSTKYRSSKNLIDNLEKVRNVLSNLCMSEYKIDVSYYTSETSKKYCNTKNTTDCVKLFFEKEKPDQKYLIPYSQGYMTYSDLNSPVIYKIINSQSPNNARIVAFNDKCLVNP